MQPTLEMIESQLMLGQVEIAARLVSMLEAAAQTDDRYWVYKQVIRRLESADGFARAGEFEHALAELAALRPHCPNWKMLEQKQLEFTAQSQKLKAEIEAIYSAQAKGNWSEAMIAAQRAQRICPKLPVARLMRPSRRDNSQFSIADRQRSHQTQGKGKKASSRRNVRVSDDSGGVEQKSDRFMVWIDGVGGYMVCQSPIVTLGQAIPGSFVEVPIQADISRRHAIIRRTGEGYVIDPLHDVQINNRPITEPTYLLDGDEIALGPRLKLRFVKKHPLSATARLDFVSRHRTSPSADGILLMADSLIMGPNSHSHVVCRDWPGDIVLFRRPEALGCRSSMPIQIGGNPVQGKTVLPFGEHLSGDGFSVTLERLA